MRLLGRGRGAAALTMALLISCTSCSRGGVGSEGNGDSSDKAGVIATDSREAAFLQRVKSFSAPGWAPWPNDAVLLEQGHEICSKLRTPGLIPEAVVFMFDPIPANLNNDEQADWQIKAAQVTLCNKPPAVPAQSGSAANSAPAGSPQPTYDASGDTQLVGPSCTTISQQYPPGSSSSLEGLASLRLSDAIATSPYLSFLAAAVSGKFNPQVNFLSALDAGQLTLFAPSDSAFEKIDKQTIDRLKNDAELLKAILTYHLVSGREAPDRIVGLHKTVQGGELKVSRSGDSLMVNAANLLCGGITTANSMIYVIDTVLLPPANR